MLKKDAEYLKMCSKSGRNRLCSASREHACSFTFETDIVNADANGKEEREGNSFKKAEKKGSNMGKTPIFLGSLDR
jgi:hypothetical protein